MHDMTMSITTLHGDHVAAIQATGTNHIVTRVLVTGVTGFVGSALTAALIHSGYVVHGTYRSQSRDKLSQLQHSDNLRLFETDLLSSRSFDEAASGCLYAVHLASPTKVDVEDVRKEIITPAVEGTRNVLMACERAGVRKILVMSCHTALSEGGHDGRPITEKHWNEYSDVSNLPICFAKTEAESVAWEFFRRKTPKKNKNQNQNQTTQLITMNPAIIWGRSLIQSPVVHSKDILIRIAQGEMAGVLDLSFPIVHIRDVVNASIKLLQSTNASGRYIVCPDNPLVSVKDIVCEMQSLGLKPPTLDLTSRALTKMIRLTSHIFPGGTHGQYIRRNIGNPVLLSNRKIVTELHLTFNDVKSVLRETLEELLEKGVIDKSEPPPRDFAKLPAMVRRVIVK